MEKFSPHSLEELLPARDLFTQEGRHYQLPFTKGKFLLVGDQHNDGRCLDYLLNRYLFQSDDYRLCWLGDYGDRSPASWVDKQSAVVTRLLKLKIQYPDRIFMVMGNHDLDPTRYIPFHSTFWNSLDNDELEVFSSILSSLPMVITTSNRVALCHAVLPPDNNFSDFDLNDEKYLDSLWGDYYSEYTGFHPFSRPARYEDDFNQSMSKGAFGCNLLVKGHSPHSPLLMYPDYHNRHRCVTIQSTRVLKGLCGMHVVEIDLSKPVNSAEDVKIINVNDLN